jgi:hypothetical protein
MANEKKSVKNTQNVLGLIVGSAIAMSATLFASCSSFPTAALMPAAISYSVLGYVGDSFAGYDEAFKAAKQKYSNADAVIAVKATADDLPLPDLITARKVILGYYAVKFGAAEKAEEKKFLGIF